jgi:hypothetical protein
VQCNGEAYVARQQQLELDCARQPRTVLLVSDVRCTAHQWRPYCAALPEADGTHAAQRSAAERCRQHSPQAARHRYHLTVGARTSAGLGACSAVSTFQTLSETPAAPVAVGVDSASISRCGLTMHWVQPAHSGGGVVAGWEVSLAAAASTVANARAPTRAQPALILIRAAGCRWSA